MLEKRSWKEKENVPDALIYEMCVKWRELKNFVDVCQLINIMVLQVRTIEKNRPKQSWFNFSYEKRLSEINLEFAGKEQKNKKGKSSEVLRCVTVMMLTSLPSTDISSTSSPLHSSHQDFCAQVKRNWTIFITYCFILYLVINTANIMYKTNITLVCIPLRMW